MLSVHTSVHIKRMHCEKSQFFGDILILNFGKRESTVLAMHNCHVIISKAKKTGSDPGGGDTLIFSYIRRLGSFLWGLTFRISIIFWGFQKNEYF